MLSTGIENVPVRRLPREAERPERGVPGGCSGRGSRGLRVLGVLDRDGPGGGRVDGLGEFGVASHPVAVAADVDVATTDPL